MQKQTTKQLDEAGHVIYDRYSLRRVIASEHVFGYRHLNHIRNLRKEALLNAIFDHWTNQKISRYQSRKQKEVI